MEEGIMTCGTPKKRGVIQREPGTKCFYETEKSLSVQGLQGPQEVLQGNPSTSPLTGQSADSNKFDQKNGERVTSFAMNLEEAVDLFTEPDKNQIMNVDETRENAKESPVTMTQGSKDAWKGGDSLIEEKQKNEPACESEGGELMDSLKNMTDALEQVAKPRHQSKLESKVSHSSTSIQADIMSIDQRLEVRDDLIATAGKTQQPLQECEASEHSDDQSRSNPIGTGVQADNMNIEQNLGFQSDLIANFSETMQPLQECVASELNDTNKSVCDCVGSISEQNSDVHEELRSLLSEQTNEAQATISNIPSTDNVEENEEHAGHMQSASKSNQEPFPNTLHTTHTNTLVLSHEAETSRETAPTSYKENYNLKHLDGQILHPPVKTPEVLGESIIKPDNRDQKRRKFNSNAATNASEVPCSDRKAGLILETLLEKRSLKNAMTQGDINEAILQGKPISPIIYLIEVESNKTTKHENLEEDQADLQESDGENHIMLWITGSHQLQKYFCWPCLLLGDNVWHVPIFWGLGDIVEAAKNHQNSEPHMSAFMKFLVHETELKREQEAQLEANFECTRQTEDLLRLSIEITCSNLIGTPEEHVELLSMACSYKTQLKEFIEQKSPDFLVDFVTSTISPILRAIKQSLMTIMLEEIENVPFVSIIFEETTDVVDKSLMAVILRYVTDSGIPKERFVKLMKMGMSRTVADFLKTINLVVQEYQLTEKFVGFTYNGTVICPQEILIFNKTVSRLYPKARFFPYQEHNFKKIVTQSLSHLPECRNFCYTINELAGFLQNAPNVMITLIGIDTVGLDMPKYQWDFENDFINTIKCHYESILSFFGQVMGQEFDWDSATVMQVKYFSCFLRSTNFRVLLLVISAILDAIEDLCKAMESNVDIDSWTRSLSEATNTLSSMKHCGLSKILQESNTLLAASDCTEVPSSITPELYEQIIDSTLLAMNHRCIDLEMAFIGPRHIEAASNWPTERQAVFQQRIDISPENFSKLKNEAKSFFENPLSADKSLEQSIKLIHDLKIVDSVHHLLRFLQLCLTLPTKDVYSSKSSPAVLRLRSYIAKNKPLKFFDLLIFMEKDTLSSMQQNDQFYEYILEYCTKSGE